MKLKSSNKHIYLLALALVSIIYLVIALIAEDIVTPMGANLLFLEMICGLSLQDQLRKKIKLSKVKEKVKIHSLDRIILATMIALFLAAVIIISVKTVLGLNFLHRGLLIAAPLGFLTYQILTIMTLNVENHKTN